MIGKYSPEEVDKMWFQQAKPGRHFIGRLPFKGDLLQALEAFAAEKQVHAGWVQVIGAVEKAVIGFYNQQKRQYEHLVFDKELEIVSCLGNISLREGRPVAHLHITLGDNLGGLLGGHLVPGTVVFAGEFFLQELIGPRLVRGPDSDTGLPLWEKIQGSD